MHLIFARTHLFQCLLIFLAGILGGGIFAFVLPQVARIYLAFIAERVLSTIGTRGAPLGMRDVIIIVGNNLIPVIVGFSLPALIASYNLRYATRHPERYAQPAGTGSTRSGDRLSSEIYGNLTAFSFVVAFMFGFIVFGLVLGHFLLSGGTSLLLEALRIIAPHAPFEIAAMLMSASVGLGIRNRLLRGIDLKVPSSDLNRRLWLLLSGREMATSFALTVLIVCVGALVEVYVSAPLAGVV